MLDVIIDTLKDGLKLLPFLFLTFLIIEYIEHKLNSEKIIKKMRKYGPILGGLLGAFPQCGFSVSATNFYITRVISLGTLIAVYLSTSDEMLPIMLAQGVDGFTIFKIILLKVIIGIIFGIIIDFLLRRKKQNIEIKELCEHENCDCGHSIILSALKHTINILAFLLIISFVINIGFHYLGEELISKIFLKNNPLSSLISSLVGLIPNCGASIIITELYLNGTITFGSAMAGLLTGSGVGILVLFKNNKNLKENMFILLLIYGIGVISGMLIDLVSMFLL